MFLKINYVIREIEVPKDSTLEFESTKSYPINIKITNPPKEYIDKLSPFDRPVSFYDAIATLEPEVKIKKFFDGLFTQFTTSGSEKIHLNQIKVPKYCDEYIRDIEKDLIINAKNLIGLLRWTQNCLGHHDPFMVRDLSALWSMNKVDWYPIPSRNPVRFHTFLKKIGRTIHLNQKEKSVIIDYLAKGINEPIYHELFREAWALRDTDPRSSLIIGYESAEVGVKTLIVKLIPDTKWLMDNIHYPPLDKVLSSYLKTLPGIKKINNQTIIPKSIKKTVKDMMEMRNKQVHAGNEPPDPVELEKELEDVRDLLLLLDYYSGYDFALSFIRPKTLQEIYHIIKSSKTTDKTE